MGRKTSNPSYKYFEFDRLLARILVKLGNVAISRKKHAGNFLKNTLNRVTRKLISIYKEKRHHERVEETEMRLKVEKSR
jgi:hypothetical protein